MNCSPTPEEIDEYQTQKLLNAVEKIHQMELAEETKYLGLSALYITQAKDKDAIKTLESLVSVGSKTSAVYRLLGDLYLGLKQFRMAEERYRQALALAANKHQDRIEKVAATAGLAAIKSVGNEQQAQQLRREVEVGLEAMRNEETGSLVLETAVKDVTSQDADLTSFISLRQDCPVKGCTIPGEIFKPHQFAYCRQCG